VSIPAVFVVKYLMKYKGNKKCVHSGFAVPIVDMHVALNHQLINLISATRVHHEKKCILTPGTLL
jgi:hypothetical protein